MKTFFSIISLSSLILLNGCITAGLPTVVIPETPKELHLQTGIGTNGAHFNASYNPLANFGLNGKLSFFTGYYGELGTAYIGKNHKLLFGLAYGHGKFDFNYPIYGGTYGISTRRGTYGRLVNSINWRFSPIVGLHTNFVGVWGKNSGWCQHICTPFKNQRFSQFYVEPDFYYRLGRKKRFIIVMGGKWLAAKISQDYESEADYNASDLHLGICFDIKFNIRS